MHVKTLISDIEKEVGSEDNSNIYSRESEIGNCIFIFSTFFEVNVGTTTEKCASVNLHGYATIVHSFHTIVFEKKAFSHVEIPP